MKAADILMWGDDRIYAIFKIEVTDTYKTFTMPTGSTVDYFVKWGDGNSENVNTTSKTHTYVNNGIYYIKFSGIVSGISFGYSSGTASQNMLKGVDSLGELVVSSLIFAYCINLEYLIFGELFNSEFMNSLSLFCYKCSSLISVDFGSIDTNNVNNMDSMFNDCILLESVNVEKLDTQNSFRFNGMFSDCASLLSVNVSNFNTARSKYFDLMFGGCELLTNIDTSGFVMTEALEVDQMFKGCVLVQNQAPDWWNTYPAITDHFEAFNGNTSRPNYASIPATWK